MKDTFAKITSFATKHQRWFLLGLIILMLVVPFLGVPSLVLRIMVMIMIYATLAMGLNIPTGYTGQVSLGNAGFFSIGAYTSAVLVTTLGWSFFITAPIAAIFAGLAGLLLGLPSLRLSGSYLSIVTLGFAEIVKMIALNWQSVTNGPMGIKNIPRPSIFGIELSLRNYGAYYLMLAIMLLVAVFCHLIINSKIGRAFISIKEDELAATMMGIKTVRYKVLAFVLSAMISGLAGAFYAHFMRYIDPNSFTFDTSILILSIVILGGMGTMRGMFLGAILLVSFPEVLRFMESYRFVMYGLILVIMMRFRPQGLLGWQSRDPYKMPKGVDVTKISGDL